MRNPRLSVTPETLLPVLLLAASLLLSPPNAPAGTEGLADEASPEEQQVDTRSDDTRLKTASVTLDDIVVRAERDGPDQTDTSLVRIDRKDVNGSLSKSVAGALRGIPVYSDSGTAGGNNRSSCGASNNVRSSS